MRLLMIPVLIVAGGCAPREARSVEYFEAHPAEAREVVEACRAGDVRGDECGHAKTAVEVAEGRERMRRFLGSDKKKSER